jgi:single-stranded-DNA-specific exonuclease
MPTETIAASSGHGRGILNSFSGRRWVLRGSDDERARALSRDAGISLVLAELLVARGIGADAVAEYLNPTLRNLLPEPLLLKDMQRAIERVRLAMEGQERIAVFGDYDVDGSSSAALLVNFFAALGTNVRLYVPDRLTEGYGPSASALLALKGEGISLVITVDCGASAVEALTEAQRQGLDVIVLDHHPVEASPPVIAHVNPNQPGDLSEQRHLCAAGVTFLFTVGLNRALREGGCYEGKDLAEPDLMSLLDLVALATICDVVPLVGVNRAFVRAGLVRLARLERPGLAALASVARIAPPFTPHHLGFGLGPRINAGGRIGKCSLGAELLSTADRATADEIATLLDLHNRERQNIEKAMLAEAVAAASGQANAAFLLAANEGWHSGVVGVVAGRLKERFLKPAFVVGFEGGMGRGSARSVVGVDVGAMVRQALEMSIIDGGGGHAMAAGFSLRASQLEGFHAFLVERFAQGADSEEARTLQIEAVVGPRGATPGLVEEIAKAGPFGAGNPEPFVMVPDGRVAFAEKVGDDHVRLRLVGADGARLDAIAFRTASQPLGKAQLAARGRTIHAVGKLRREEWQGRERVQLHLEDAAAADA